MEAAYLLLICTTVSPLHHVSVKRLDCELDEKMNFCILASVLKSEKYKVLTADSIYKYGYIDMVYW